MSFRQRAIFGPVPLPFTGRVVELIRFECVVRTPSLSSRVPLTDHVVFTNCRESRYRYH